MVEAVIKNDGICLITADHGNVEEMMENGEPKTAHTTNPVPFIVIGENVELRNGILGDIAPTILQMMGIKKPEEMTGKTLIVE